jgi:GT2 family glycosyltransferase
MVEKVTVGIVNYNGMETLPACLNSVFDLEYPSCDVIVVDNSSTDGSREWLQIHHPQVRLICLDQNLGLPGARNVILSAAATKYILSMDNDIVLEPDALSRLMEVMEKVPQAAVCHPEISDPEDPTVHHYNGGWIHFLCVFVSRPKPGKTSRAEYEVFATISGGALLIDRAKALQVGAFDEDYFFNWEDGDFASRCTLAGYLCLNVPSAVVNHRSKPRGRSKVFYQVRNRWFFILKLYSWRTLFWTAPMLLSFELLQGLFLGMQGAARDYLRGNLAVMRHFPKLMKKRKAFQKLKAYRDRDWLTTGDLYIPQQLSPKGLSFQILKFYETMLAAYWRLVRHLC